MSRNKLHMTTADSGKGHRTKRLQPQQSGRRSQTGRWSQTGRYELSVALATKRSPQRQPHHLK